MVVGWAGSIKMAMGHKIVICGSYRAGDENAHLGWGAHSCANENVGESSVKAEQEQREATSCNS